MAASGLTDAQAQAVAALVQAGRIQQAPLDPARAAAFLASAADTLGQLPLLTSFAVEHALAYDAAHDVGEALLAAYGYRTTGGAGQHEALGRFVRAVFEEPPTDVAARRRKRPAQRLSGFTRSLWRTVTPSNRCSILSAQSE